MPDIATAVGVALPYKYPEFFFIHDESFPCVIESAIGTTFIGQEIWILWPLKMGPIGCPETSVRNYRYTLRYFPSIAKYSCTILLCFYELGHGSH